MKLNFIFPLQSTVLGARPPYNSVCILLLAIIKVEIKLVFFLSKHLLLEWWWCFDLNPSTHTQVSTPIFIICFLFEIKKEIEKPDFIKKRYPSTVRYRIPNVYTLRREQQAQNFCTAQFCTCTCRTFWGKMYLIFFYSLCFFSHLELFFSLKQVRCFVSKFFLVRIAFVSLLMK